MSIAIFARDESQPLPRAVSWWFVCDGDHGLLLPMAGEYAGYSEAMRAGWKETFVDSKRLFLGPCCSGKEARHG